MVSTKWHLRSKQVEKRVDLHHDSDRDEKGHVKSKQLWLTIMGRIKWYLQAKQVENRVDLYHDSIRDERSYWLQTIIIKNNSYI